LTFDGPSREQAFTASDISAKGSRKTLRTAVYQAALSCIRRNSHLTARYLKILAHQPNKKKIKPKVLAIASKLLRIVYRMVTKKKLFDPGYDKTLKERLSQRALKAA